MKLIDRKQVIRTQLLKTSQKNRRSHAIEIDEIVKAKSDSRSYKGFIEMEFNQPVDAFMSYYPKIGLEDFLEIFDTQGINRDGGYEARRKLKKSDFAWNYVYENYEEILTNEDFWSFGRKRPHLRLGRDLEEIYYRKKNTRIWNFRKNFLEILDEKCRTKFAIKERSFLDLRKKQKKIKFFVKIRSKN